MNLVSARNFTKVDAIKRQILRLYKNDINKYAGGAKARVGAIYDAIPGQLQKKEKKFGQYLSTPYVLHTKDVETKDGLVYLPLYMTPLL